LKKGAGGFGLQKIYERGILEIEKRPPTRWVAVQQVGKAALQLGKVLGRFFYARITFCSEK